MVLRKIDSLGVKVNYKDIIKETANREKLQSDTGRSTVPCLYINGEPMFESADIMEWLEKNKGQLEKI